MGKLHDWAPADERHRPGPAIGSGLLDVAGDDSVQRHGCCRGAFPDYGSSTSSLGNRESIGWTGCTHCTYGMISRMDAEVTAALIGAGVGVGTLGGTLAGAILGARIQARGGHDQAAAARDAPTIQAREARAEALRATRQATWTRFLSTSRECLAAAEALYEADDGTAVQKRHQLEDALSETELVGPPSMGDRAQEVMAPVRAAYDLAVTKGMVSRAQMALDAAAELEIAQSGQTGPAHQARVGLTTLTMVVRARQHGTQTDTDYYAHWDAAQEALRSVPVLDRQQAWALIGDATDLERDETADRRQRAISEYQAARRGFLTAARTYLGTEAEPL